MGNTSVQLYVSSTQFEVISLTKWTTVSSLTGYGGVSICHSRVSGKFLFVLSVSKGNKLLVAIIVSIMEDSDI